MYRAKGKSTESPKAVNFFLHFIINFLHLYGIAHKGLTEEDIILKWLAPMNCRWLLRPKVAASEFADTCIENLKYLASGELKFLDSEKFSECQDNLEEFIGTLQKLNTTNDKADATANDVKTFLKKMLADDSNMNKFFEDLVKAGSSMYLLGIHYTVVKTILSNPEWYAEKSVGDSKELRDFKERASIPALKTYPTQTCTPTTRKGKQEPKKNSMHQTQAPVKGEAATVSVEETIKKNKTSKKSKK